mmetsp:Transcript_90565/g.189421  ORF Transcript_90565/g.189421 Transcript_90565/m.189421 type:complete len:115 (+) Transcript_90565:539-883(+)
MSAPLRGTTVSQQRIAPAPRIVIRQDQRMRQTGSYVSQIRVGAPRLVSTQSSQTTIPHERIPSGFSKEALLMKPVELKAPRPCARPSQVSGTQGLHQARFVLKAQSEENVELRV